MFSSFTGKQKFAPPPVAAAAAVPVEESPSIIYVGEEEVFVMNDAEPEILISDEIVKKTDVEILNKDKTILETIRAQIARSYSETKQFLANRTSEGVAMVKSAASTALFSLLSACYGTDQVDAFRRILNGEDIDDFPNFIENIINNFSNFIVNHRGVYNFTINKLTPIIINAVDDNIKKIFLTIGQLKTVKLDEMKAQQLDLYFKYKNATEQERKAGGISQEALVLPTLFKTNLVNILQLLIEVFTILNVIEVQELANGLSPKNKTACVGESKSPILEDEAFKKNLHTLTKCFRDQSKSTKYTFDIVIKLLIAVIEKAKVPYTESTKIYKWDETAKLFTPVKNLFDENSGKFMYPLVEPNDDDDDKAVSQDESDKAFTLIAFVLVLLNNITDQLKRAEEEKLKQKPGGRKKKTKARRKLSKKRKSKRRKHLKKQIYP